MTNPQYKLGNAQFSLYRDLVSDKTFIRNSNINVLEISGTDTDDALIISKTDPVVRVLSTNTGVTSSSSITMGISGGDVWDISTGISGGVVNTDLDFFINKNGANKLTILDNGNIGIGTTNPTYNLDVNGSTNTSVDYKVNGTSVLTETTLESSVVNSSLQNLGTQDADLNMGTNNITNATTISASELSATSIVGLITTPVQTNITSVGTLSGLNVDGTVDATNIIATNITGTLQTVSQPNITSLGTLSSLNITGDLITDTNTLVVDSATDQVGIGLTNPSYKLDVVGDLNFTGTLYQNGITYTASASSINDVDSTTSITTQAEAETLIFTTDSSEKMRINTTGYVGIGNISPIAPIHIGTATNQDLIYFDIERAWVLRAADTGAATALEFSNTAGSGKRFLITEDGSGNTAFTALPTFVPADQRVYLCQDGGNVGIGTNNSSYPLLTTSATTGIIGVFETTLASTASTIRTNTTRANTGNAGILHFARNDITISGLYGVLTDTTNNYGDLSFYTRDVGGLTEKMSLSSTGYLGIGTGTPTQKLHVNSGAILLKQAAQTNNNSTDLYNGLTFVNNGTNHAYGLGYNNGGSFAINYFNNVSTYSNYLTLSNTGNLSIAGWVRGGTAGQLLNTIVLNATDVGDTGNLTINTTTYTTVFTYNYTRVSSSSNIVVNIDCPYGINGNGGDTFRSRIVIGGTSVIEKFQTFDNSSGGGTRGSTICPIQGKYTNSATGSITITFESSRFNGDDSFTFQRGTSSGLSIVIQEIQR